MNGPQMSASAVSSLMKELRRLQRRPMEDIQVQASLSGDRLTGVEATVEGPQGTPFEGGSFRVALSFPHDFPHAPPEGRFVTRIFHPNVQPDTGEICVDTLKRGWKSEYGLRHVLIAVRSLLVVPNYDSALNEEAGHLLNEGWDMFAQRARLFTRVHALSKEHKSEGMDGQVPGKENTPQYGGPGAPSSPEAKSDDAHNLMGSSSNSSSSSSSSSGASDGEGKPKPKGQYRGEGKGKREGEASGEEEEKGEGHGEKRKGKVRKGRGREKGKGKENRRTPRRKGKKGRKGGPGREQTALGRSMRRKVNERRL